MKMSITLASFLGTGSSLDRLLLCSFLYTLKLKDHQCKKFSFLFAHFNSNYDIK